MLWIVLWVVLCAESVWVCLALLCTMSVLHASNKLCVRWEVEEGEVEATNKRVA